MSFDCYSSKYFITIPAGLDFLYFRVQFELQLQAPCRLGATRPRSAGVRTFLNRKVLKKVLEIDALVRAHLAPLLESFFRSSEPMHPADAVTHMGDVLQRSFPQGIPLSTIRWSPGPFVNFLWSTSMRDHAIMTEQFEFSAAHRLHCPELSDDENRRTFGKCNHPSGHGHNYRIAVAVRVRTGAGAPGLSTGALEGIVTRTVLDRFDHRHLNVDCPEFAELNPSVENIAQVCHALLSDEIAAAGAALDHVTVWETAKTSATYPARSLAD